MVWYEDSSSIFHLCSTKIKLPILCSEVFLLQGEPGLSADFYFKENSDGSVSFESVLCLGGFVCIPSAAPQSNLFVYKIVSWSVL